jgi:catechol 2,3-dioxygenase-like lactoylglutathione lyase family enzyme
MARGGARDGGDVTVRGEAGDPTDQESRSPGHQAATRVTAMDLTIHTTFLPHDDPDASLAFWRDILGFEVRNDVGSGKMRWITVGPADQPGTSILLGPPAADPGITDDERRTIVEMMAKGTYGWIILATSDLDGTFERLQASDAEVVQEPTEQPYGIRDCAFRDPAGNLIRVQELR